MPLLDGPIATFLKKRKLLIGGALIGIYFLGASQGWWERFLF